MWIIQKIGNSRNFVEEMVGYEFQPLVFSDDDKKFVISEIFEFLDAKDDFTVTYQEDEVM